MNGRPRPSLRRPLQAVDRVSFLMPYERRRVCVRACAPPTGSAGRECPGGYQNTHLSNPRGCMNSPPLVARFWDLSLVPPRGVLDSLKRGPEGVADAPLPPSIPTPP